MTGLHKIRPITTFAASAVLLAAAFAGPNRLIAADNSWLTGEPLRQALAQPMGVKWSNIPAREAIEGLGKSKRVAVMLDRRVDPDQKIELVFDDVPLAEGFERIASRLGVGFTMLGPVAYFGPKSTTPRLRTIAAMRKDEAAKLPVAARIHWNQMKPLKWEPLATPRDLLTGLTHEAGLTVDGIDRIPHDLWAGADLPPLGLPERLTIVLSQFDLTYEPAADGLSLKLAPLPENPIIERTYAVQGSAPEAAANLKKQNMLSGVEIAVAGNKLVVRGRQEVQDVVDDILSGRGAKKTTVTEGRKVYTLRVPVEKPVGKLLEELGPALKIEIHTNQEAIKAAGLSLDKLVTLDVKNATADELLHAALEPAGLTFRRQSDTIEIIPKR